MLERDAMRWLQLTYKVPSEPSQKRVWVWRRLQNLGAYALQNSVYLLPLSEEVEKHFRQLAHEIHEMGGEASIFCVMALDIADERRILQTLVEARTNEYNTVIKVCSRFLTKAAQLVETQNWDDQVHAEFTEVLEKVHVLFRTAKRHDMLGALTASKRADAAEALNACEQIFRVLLDQEYTRARRLLDLHSDLFVPVSANPEPNANANASRTPEQVEQISGSKSSTGSESDTPPELPI
ncbi:MAG TPA: Chromate resistance protein ChrB [Ktedonobacteraceae bacterium]|nr:Chromate resistance protein ChrB [Ktedonobacteraceae bacterium]